jgi:hypothetical protein
LGENWLGEHSVKEFFLNLKLYHAEIFIINICHPAQLADHRSEEVGTACCNWGAYQSVGIY